MSRRASHLCLLLLGALMLLSAASAQAQDVKKEHSAKKAGYLSILPGAGQIYNGKWWKVPIIYAGFGGIGYMAYSNYSDYKTFLTAYKIKTGNLDVGDTQNETAIQLTEYYQASQLQSYKDSYRRDFELYCIILAAWYGLNIVDAIVDGHLYTYDISDDLSLQIDPCLQSSQAPYLPITQYAQVGLSFNLNLK
ncbi:MAG: hypothetical protein IKU00_09750 [Bacteroidales bacterium]|nr:hypothetical protein [Bacteroidales bacterium]